MSLFSRFVTEIVGNVGKEPEMRFTPTGDAVCTFSVGISMDYKPRESETYIKRTVWVRVTVWGAALADLCHTRLHKGSKVLVSGTLGFDPETGGPKVWQGKNGPGASFELTAKEIVFLDKKSADTEGQPEGEVMEAEETVPF